MFAWLAKVSGWTAVIVIAVLAGLGTVFQGVPLVRKILWTLAALVAVLASFHEWTNG